MFSVPHPLCFYFRFHTVGVSACTKLPAHGIKVYLRTKNGLSKPVTGTEQLASLKHSPMSPDNRFQKRKSRRQITICHLPEDGLRACLPMCSQIHHPRGAIAIILTKITDIIVMVGVGRRNTDHETMLTTIADNTLESL